MLNLENRIALVTGAASGIGAGIAKALWEAGATVIFSDINRNDGEERTRQFGSRTEFQFLDTSDSAAWAEVVEDVEARHGRLDILVNNAGAAAPVRRLDMEPIADFDRINAINLRGVWLGTRAVIPLMQKAGGGSVINIASIDSFIGVAGMSTYVATKFGVLGLTKSTALELGPLGIRVNAVHPGIIDTPAVNRLPGHVMGQLAAAVAKQPIARLGTPEDVARAVLFFASDLSAYCTGASLLVDGGHIAGRFRDLDAA